MTHTDNKSLVERAEKWLEIEREFIDVGMLDTSATTACDIIRDLLAALRALTDAGYQITKRG